MRTRWRLFGTFSASRSSDPSTRMSTYAYIPGTCATLKSTAADPGGRPHEAHSMITAMTQNPTGRIHAVVWLDHHEARIFRFDSEVSEATHHVICDGHS